MKPLCNACGLDIEDHMYVREVVFGQEFFMHIRCKVLGPPGETLRSNDE